MAGIPSPAASDDSGLCSIGLEGIQPLNISPLRGGSLTEETVAGLSSVITAESMATSLLVHKFSPFSNCSSNYNRFSSSSLGSSLRKRLNDEELEVTVSGDEMVSMVKTPRFDNYGN